MVKSLDSDTLFGTFGIKEEIDTHGYVIWLATEEGRNFLKRIEIYNNNFTIYWTMHEAKSKVIGKYAIYQEELKNSL